ncbi:MAG: hypothetical protein HC778_06705 [Chamaesiphon sp. CSU_1_12]|nr:hypothetical protein [Chamaesiphon sp. CSU_1_12]
MVGSAHPTAFNFTTFVTLKGLAVPTLRIKAIYYSYQLSTINYQLT